LPSSSKKATMCSMLVPCAGDLADFHAFQYVIGRPTAGRRVGVADGAQAIGVVLKDVGVDGPDLNPQFGGVPL
jgi:hypothetical protein